MGRYGGTCELLKQLTILSGKGGTGKTTLTGSFAALAHNPVIADCDVDAPNLHLLLKPRIIKRQELEGSKKAVIDETKCTRCGKCEEYCRFDAIKELVVDPVLCEGCGVCVYVCPTEAVTLETNVDGFAFVSETDYGPMSHARLNPGQENSGKLVTLVRNNAKEIAEKKNNGLVLIDGPPGIGCPVIASITGVDLGLIVAEPTLSSIHDVERALDLLNHFRIHPLICINRYDLNEENTGRIKEFCAKKGVEVVGEIPFDPIITQSMVAGKPVIEYSPNSAVSKAIRETWDEILMSLDTS